MVKLEIQILIIYNFYHSIFFGKSTKSSVVEIISIF